FFKPHHVGVQHQSVLLEKFPRPLGPDPNLLGTPPHQKRSVHLGRHHQDARATAHRRPLRGVSPQIRFRQWPHIWSAASSANTGLGNSPESNSRSLSRLIFSLRARSSSTASGWSPE